MNQNVKDGTVIDLNTTDVNLYMTENQTVQNGIFNSINGNSNITYFDSEKGNKSFIMLSEIAARDSLTISENLSAAGITGITLGFVLIVGFISIISYIIYRNKSINRPQVLNDHCSNLDSSGYIDDTSVRVSTFYLLTC